MEEKRKYIYIELENKKKIELLNPIRFFFYSSLIHCAKYERERERKRERVRARERESE